MTVRPIRFRLFPPPLVSVSVQTDALIESETSTKLKLMQEADNTEAKANELSTRSFWEKSYSLNSSCLPILQSHPNLLSARLPQSPQRPQGGMDIRSS